MTSKLFEAFQRRTDAQPSELTNLAVYYLAFISQGIYAGILGPTLPGMAERSAVTVGTLGIIFTVRSLGYLIGSVTLGGLFDRMKAHTLMGWSQLASAVLVLSVAWTKNFSTLIVLFFLSGLTISLLSVGANMSIVWIFKERSGPPINGLHFTFGLGAFLSPLIVAQLLRLENGLSLSYWIAGAYFILTGLIMLRLGNNPVPQRTEESMHETTARKDFLLIGLTALFLFFYVGTETSFGGWYYTYVITQGLAAKSSAAYMNSAFWLSFTFGRLLSVWVATRMHQKKVLPIALVGALASISILIFLPPQGTLLWITPIALGFFMAPIFPTAFSWISQSMQLSGKLTGILYIGDSFGAMILPWMIGQVIDATGPATMVPLILGSLTINFIVYFGLLAAHQAYKKT